MKLLDRYIMRTVVGHSLVVLAVLLGLYFFSTLIREMGYVGKGSYDTKDAVLISLMLLPRQAYELFPMVALLGSMLGLGSLASNSELTVMRAAGISINRMTVSVLKAGLLMIVAVIVVGEGIAPELEKQAHNLKLEALVRGVSLNTGDRLWAKDGDSYISIRRLEPTGEAKGVMLYHMQGQRLLEIAQASSARYIDGQWQFSGVQRTQFGDEGVFVSKLEKMSWPSRLAPDMINLASMKPENLSVWELVELVDFMRQNGLASQRYEVAMWTRVFGPIATGGMILLALPFVFGSLRSVGVGARVMSGALIGIAFYLITNVISRMGLLYDISPVISAATPAMLVFISWMIVMRRMP